MSRDSIDYAEDKRTQGRGAVVNSSVKLKRLCFSRMKKLPNDDYDIFSAQRAWLWGVLGITDKTRNPDMRSCQKAKALYGDAMDDLIASLPSQPIFGFSTKGVEK